MPDTGMKIIPRGKGWHNTGATIASADYGGVAYEGTVRVFRDKTPVTTVGPSSTRSGGDQVCRLVRNVSTVRLKPKRLVTWASGYRNKRVDGYARLTAGEVAGVVDEHGPADGFHIGELFWLVIKGPVLVKTGLAGDGTNVWSDGSILVAETVAASTGTTAGRPVPQDLTGATSVLGDQIQNAIGRALSARTTGQTDTDTLVALDLR